MNLKIIKKEVQIFSDGSCLRNPGPGGYGTILRYYKYEKILSKGYFLTTNNRMELIGVIVGLESLRYSCNVIVTTDSNYVCQGGTKWIYLWKKKNWKRSNGLPVSNIDLWIRMNKIIKKHKIKWNLIKGHSGHLENTFCDKLAKNAANNPSQEDQKYLEIYLEKNKL
ncbi:RNase H [Candidatus Riesia pediculicola USDA]|uniref:Ribonuclease H n=1 Tax=Riesia pediculicola (strain USDA) TaxID=515618 RepID=D4G823_RIEPU|nr:RNase H [Candidatus Riesia pediculicola USDA]